MGKTSQKKPEINEMIFKLYSKGMTLRGIAEVLGVSRTTVNRKFLLIAQNCKDYHEYQLSLGYKSKRGKPIVIFDEMESHEQTKLKPLSIGVLFDFNNRKILHFNVGEMRTRGRGLPAIWNSIYKMKGYKPRVDERSDLTLEAFLIADNYYQGQKKVVLLTDNKPLYGNIYKFLDPVKFQHVFALRGQKIKLTPNKKKIKIRSKIVKLKFKIYIGMNLIPKPPYAPTYLLSKTQKYEKLLNSAFDSFNKLCAVIRNDTSRLRRTTFINTQKPERLELNLFMFLAYYNDYKFRQIMSFNG